MFIAHGKKQLQLTRPLPVPLHHDEDLRGGGWRTCRTRYVRAIVLHWGGVSRASIRRTLIRRGLSTHFAVDTDGVWQWLDTRKVAYHCGKHNRTTIGVDICQWPLVDALRHYPAPEWDVQPVPFRSARTRVRQVLSLDSRLVANTRALVLELCDAFHVPLEAPPADCVVDHLPRGVVGHHHLTRNKWDILPWWGQIFDDWNLFKESPT